MCPMSLTLKTEPQRSQSVNGQNSIKERHGTYHAVIPTFTVAYEVPVASPADGLLDCRAVRKPVTWVARKRYHGAAVCVGVIRISVFYIQ